MGPNFQTTPATCHEYPYHRQNRQPPQDRSDTGRMAARPAQCAPCCSPARLPCGPRLCATGLAALLAADERVRRHQALTLNVASHLIGERLHLKRPNFQTTPTTCHAHHRSPRYQHRLHSKGHSFGWHSSYDYVGQLQFGALSFYGSRPKIGS